MNLTIRPVEAQHVQQAWPFVEQYIAEALQKGEDFPEETKNYNIHHVQAFLSAGQWMLLIAVDEENKVHGAATVSFISYPMHRVAFITAIGGKLISSQETFDQLKRLLKSYGATKIQGFGRESIVRLWQRYNFEARHTLVEVLI
jgi:hypothetical protein